MHPLPRIAQPCAARTAPARRRVLILDATVGGGHRSVADAIASALEARLGDRVGVHRADAYAVGRWPAPRASALYAATTVHVPALWRVAYAATDGTGAAGCGWLLHRFLVPAFQDLLASKRPHLVLTTVPVVGRALAAARAALAHRAPWLTVVTDLGHAHATWFAPGVTEYLTPSQETYRECQEACKTRGRPASNVRYTGLPVRPAFCGAHPAQPVLRAGLGWPVEGFTVLVLSGAEGAGPTVRLAQALARAAPSARQVIVCGHNERLRQALRALGIPSLEVHGYLEDLAAPMAAADVVVSKAGGATIAEALAVGRPLVISSALPGQEEANARHLARCGAARVALGPQRAACTIARLAAAPAEREALRAAGRAMGEVHARAAGAVAAIVERWLERAAPDAGQLI